MSRSYKKNPGYTDYSRGRTKYMKRLASKSVRNYDGNLSNGCSYKKLLCSYDIRDWKCIYYGPSDYSYYSNYRQEWVTTPKYKPRMKWFILSGIVVTTIKTTIRGSWTVVVQESVKLSPWWHCGFESHPPHTDYSKGNNMKLNELLIQEENKTGYSKIGFVRWVEFNSWQK